MQTPELIKLDYLINYVECSNILCSECKLNRVCDEPCSSPKQAKDMIEGVK